MDENQMRRCWLCKHLQRPCGVGTQNALSVGMSSNQQKEGGTMKRFRVTGMGMDFGRFADEMSARMVADRIGGVVHRWQMKPDGSGYKWVRLPK